LIILNAGEGYSPYPVLRAISIGSMKVEFGPYNVAFCRFVKDFYLDIGSRFEKRTPIAVNTGPAGKVSLRVKRLLAAKVQRKARYHGLQIV
jgi:hypothetical protein